MRTDVASLREAMHRNHLLARERVVALGQGAAYETVGPWTCLDGGAQEFAVINGAAVVNGAAVADLALALAWFERRGLAPVFELRSDVDATIIEALRSRGFQQRSSMPEMLLREPQPPAYDGPLEILEVRTADELARYGRLNWEPPMHHIGLAIAQNSERLGFAMFLGRLEGRDVAVAASLASGGMVGVYNVGVQPEVRRHGFGEAMTRAAIAGGIARGARYACLGASDMGFPLYQRMGFETEYQYVKLAAP